MIAATPRTMLAAVLTAPRTVRATRRAVPEPGEEEVLLRVRSTGICGTDVAVYRGDYPATLPRVMGHEFSGEVVEVGSSVADLEPGQRVIAEGSWRRDEAAAGEPAAIQRLGRNVDGSFAEFVVVPRKAVHALPATIPHLAAQSLTTLATAVRAAKRAGELIGKSVVVVGAGHAGLLLQQVATEMGAASITMLGTRRLRLEVARRLGAVAAVDVRDAAYPAWQRDAAGRGFDVAFEASGTAAGLAESFVLVRPQGTVVSYGIIATDLAGVPGDALYAKELTVLGSQGGDDEYEDAIQLLAYGLVKVEPLVTHVLPLGQVAEGLELMLGHKDSAIRVVFDIGSSGEES